MMRWLTNLIGTVLGVDQGPDPAWKPTGYRYTQEGTDEARGVAAVQHADKLATARRKLAARRAEPRS